MVIETDEEFCYESLSSSMAFGSNGAQRHVTTNWLWCAGDMTVTVTCSVCIRLASLVLLVKRITKWYAAIHLPFSERR